MGLDNVGMYFKLDAILAFDNKIGFGVVEIGMKGFFGSSHFESSVRVMLRDGKERCDDESRLSKVVVKEANESWRIAHTSSFLAKGKGSGVSSVLSGLWRAYSFWSEAA